MHNTFFAKSLILAVTGGVLAIPYPQSHQAGMSVNGKANLSGSGYGTSVRGQGSVGAKNISNNRVFNKSVSGKGSVSGRGSTKPVTKPATKPVKRRPGSINAGRGSTKPVTKPAIKPVKGRPGQANSGRGTAKPITKPSKGRPAPARTGKGTIKPKPLKTVGGKGTSVTRKPTRPVNKIPVKGRGSTGVNRSPSKAAGKSYSTSQSTTMHDDMPMDDGDMSMDHGDMPMGDDDMSMNDDMPGMDHGSSGGGSGSMEGHDMTEDDDDEEEGGSKGIASKVAGGVFGLVKDNPATRFLGAHCSHGHVCPQMPIKYIDQVKGIFNGDFDKVLNRQYDESMFHLGEKTPEDIGAVHSTIKTLTGY